MNGTAQVKRSQPAAMETLQFRALIAIAFVWFFLGALVRKLIPAGSTGSPMGESCFQSAKRAAYSVVPYAFMRV